MYPAAAIITCHLFLGCIALYIMWLRRRDSFTFCQECGNVYAPSERHGGYTLRRGSSYAAAIYPTPSAVYAVPWPIATFFLSAIVIFPNAALFYICLTLRSCDLLQYSLRFGFIACHCICFAIIVFYRSEIFCPIFTLSSTMPSVSSTMPSVLQI